MKQIRYDKRVSILLVFSSLILCLICLMAVMWFKTGEEASVGIFSLAVTLIGTMFIAIELKNSQNVTCSDMLIDLNNYFHDSDRLMKVYEALEENAVRPDDTKAIWRDVKGVEVAQYCTFFENLYLLYRHHIAEIEDLDDLFGYRFFLFMNNSYIQENYTLPTSSSYVQIFELYTAWIAYREKINGSTPGGERRIPGYNNRFSDRYLRDKLYMHEICTDDMLPERNISLKGRNFKFRRLKFEDMASIMHVQERAVASLPDTDMFFALSREELLESIHLDRLAGIFTDDGRLVAFAVIVGPRGGDRNLAAETGADPLHTITFDAVAVDPDWRGYGFHRFFIDRAFESMDRSGASKMLATVSPDNRHSLDNFAAKGFKIIDTRIKYGGLKRHILEYEAGRR